LTIQITELGIFAIAYYNQERYEFKYEKIEKETYYFKIIPKSSNYLQLIITNNVNVYLIGNTTILQLTVDGETCGWAPPEISRNNSAANALRILRNSENISEKILNSLREYSPNVSNYGRIQISHNGSSIISITTDEQPKLYLIPENNLQFNFINYENDCYKFRNDITSLEIWICNSGEIIFQKTGTNIKGTFTPLKI
jgi:hypothetical protein